MLFSVCFFFVACFFSCIACCNFELRYFLARSFEESISYIQLNELFKVFLLNQTSYYNNPGLFFKPYVIICLFLIERCDRLWLLDNKWYRGVVIAITSSRHQRFARETSIRLTPPHRPVTIVWLRLRHSPQCRVMSSWVRILLVICFYRGYTYLVNDLIR